MMVIIDYRAGNLRSVQRALNYLNIDNKITEDYKEVEKANSIIFPGVGAAYSAMKTLHELALDRALKEAYNKGIPILGICLGSQIILSQSQEGPTPCLDLIPGEVKHFPMKDMKIPHMGWNSVQWTQEHPVLKDVPSKSEFYFVHSYYTDPESKANIFGQTEYGIPFTSVLGKKNLIALQFHPEKSGKVGLQILQNFAAWNGELYA